MENLYAEFSIRTYTGKYFNFKEPTHDMICIEDIAHALSQEPRFGGHLPKQYSVAEHSIRCAELMKTDELKFEALMHDAHEAYVKDLPSPLKKMLPDYQDLEKKIQKMVGWKFKYTVPTPQEIKKADIEMLENEWNLIMLESNVDYKPMTAHEAESTFLWMFNKYNPYKN